MICVCNGLIFLLARHGRFWLSFFILFIIPILSAHCNKRMACLTMIYCGMCPYEDRCVFLHDPLNRSAHEVKCRPIKVSHRNSGPGSPGSPSSRDTFYW